MFVSPGAITALVDRLEKAGHLERVANPSDRRSSLLRTTPSGREAMVAQVLPLASEVDRIAASLSERELAAVEGFLREVTAATAAKLKALVPAGPPAGPPAGRADAPRRTRARGGLLSGRPGAGRFRLAALRPAVFDGVDRELRAVPEAQLSQDL